MNNLIPIIKVIIGKLLSIICSNNFNIMTKLIFNKKKW